MGRVYSFHETVIGHLHVLNDLPCEDSSISFSEEGGKYCIVVVADGHGSKSCYRSALGSKLATEITLECLRQFADSTLATEETENRFYMDVFTNPRYQKMTVRRLTDTIIARWYDAVLKDFNDNPPTLEEVGENTTEYPDSKTAHIYGTTLIAALQLPKCLILIQQGDGRCDVFYGDGSVEQPIPWDVRCEDTTTTSLCDEDAAESIRSCIINLIEKPVMACFLCCDGVEDAYRDTYEELGGSHGLMGGVHTFFKDLICQLAKTDRSDFEVYLKSMLPEFSKNGRFSRSGSGDDVSVAGIVDIDSISRYVPEYEFDVNLYALEEDLFWKEDELRGKTRKHGILKKRVLEAKAACEDAREQQQALETQLEKLKIDREEYEKAVESAKTELDKYREDSLAASGQFEGKFQAFSEAIQRFIDDISIGYSRKQAAYDNMLEKLSEYDKQIETLEEDCQQSLEKTKNLEMKLEEEKMVFDEYDLKYKEIDSDRIRIENAIVALQEGNIIGNDVSS